MSPRPPPTPSAPPNEGASSCPGDHHLLAYVEGTLAPGERQRLDQHLVRCAACAQIVADVTQQLYPEPSTHPKGPAIQGDKPSVLRVERYELLEELGAGAMGVVYRARDPGLGRDVAVKLIRPELLLTAGGESLRARFQREAKLLAKLSHGNVVPVYDSGESAQGLYIVMEYVAGSPLSDWLVGQRPTGPEIIQLFLQVGRGLAAAHDRGLVHRDIKPDNILLGLDGRARVVDFGLAVQALDKSLVAASPEEITRLTQSGALLGTPAYMAPEQLAGHTADARADQYAFCVSLLEAVFGQQLQNRQRWLESALGDQSQPQARRPVPDSLRRVLRRGLSTHAADRYPNMHALLDELSGSAAPMAWAARPRQRRRLWLVAALGALMLVAGGWFWAHHIAGSAGKDDRARAPRKLPSQRSTLHRPMTPAPTSPARAVARPPSTAVDPRIDLAPQAHPSPERRRSTRRSTGAKSAGEPSMGTSAPDPRRLAAPPIRRPPAESIRRPPPRRSSAPREAAARPTANDKWQARSKRQQARQAAARRKGRRCLSLLDAADKLDPRGRGPTGMIRARCEMLSGQCARGRRRFRRIMGTVAGYSRAQLEALERSAVKRYCP